MAFQSLATRQATGLLCFDMLICRTEAFCFSKNLSCPFILWPFLYLGLQFVLSSNRLKQHLRRTQSSFENTLAQVMDGSLLLTFCNALCAGKSDTHYNDRWGQCMISWTAALVGHALYSTMLTMYFLNTLIKNNLMYFRSLAGIKNKATLDLLCLLLESHVPIIT